MNRRSSGKIGEDKAVEYLTRKGYAIVVRNYRFEHGEIDLVARDGEELVFVEVKSRHSMLFGNPEDAVSVHKRRQLRKTAEGYLFEHDIENVPCRFDVIAIQYSGDDYEVRHYVHAF